MKWFWLILMLIPFALLWALGAACDALASLFDWLGRAIARLAEWVFER